MIIVVSCFWLCSKAFNFWETCRLPSSSTRHLQAPKNNPVTFHRSAGAQRLRRPAWKSAIPPLWFHDVPHEWRPEAFARQYASASDNRQNDTRPTQPDGLHLELARVSSALCHNPIISHRVRGMRNKNQFISLFLFLELSLASPASYNRAHSSAVRESSQYAPNLPHSCRSPSVCRTPTHSKRLYF